MNNQMLLSHMWHAAIVLLLEHESEKQGCYLRSESARRTVGISAARRGETVEQKSKNEEKISSWQAVLRCETVSQFCH